MIVLRSLDACYLTGKMYPHKYMSAVLKLAEVLPQTKIQTLRCLPAKCSRPLLAPVMNANMHLRPFLMNAALESDE